MVTLFLLKKFKQLMTHNYFQGCHMWKIILLALCLIISKISYASNLPIQLLKLPPHFSISMYAFPVPDARQMAPGPNNIVFVGTREKGKVYALIPNKNHTEASVITIASDLNMPNGVAYRDNNLYIVDVDRILIFKNIIQNLNHPTNPIIIKNILPSDTHHGWRYIKFGPDGKLYVGVGAPCNNCLRDDARFASIVRMDSDGSHQEVYAHGVRNTVGFDWDPTNQQLWFTDNGRDWMGDNTPPDELNHAIKVNLHFGFPYCHGKNISDPEFGKKFPCSSFVAPTLELSPHAASLGMIFYKGNLFPKEYQNQIFIAQHGSWNRSTKIGYDVINVKRNGKELSSNIFISGWLQKDKPWGRPVDILEMNDGSLLISDDYAGVVYRVFYSN
jgi:glucose/arabinose dehydrogenase